MGIEGVGHMVVPGPITLRLSLEGQRGIALIADEGKAHMLAGQRSSILPWCLQTWGMSPRMG